MTRIAWSLLCLALASGLCVAAALPADSQPDDDGYIRDWLILAPIPLDADQSGGDGLDQIGIANEAKVRPQDGDKASVKGKDYVWRKHTARDSHLDFNDFLGGQTEDCVAYAVTYVIVDAETKDLQLKVGSDDQCKIWLNGKELLKYTEPRALEKDADTASEVTLQAGVNVIVFKVVNEKVDFSGSVRFLDSSGQPFRKFKVSTSPK